VTIGEQETAELMKVYESAKALADQESKGQAA
jgi:DNA relaxase NicK